MKKFNCLILLTILCIIMAVVPAGALADAVLMPDTMPGNPVLIVQSEMPAASPEQPEKIPIPQGRTAEENIPMGQTGDEARAAEAGIGADVFGRQGGRLHPFVSFQVLHTDNVFATDQNTEKDWVTTIA
ncbi:MAG: hypothetical protein V2J08_11180, partial [Desulfotignum sp.]|nr:hypothetical protein [Desulfotignum sp.]